MSNNHTNDDKNKYLTIFEILPCPVAVLDQDYRVDTVNHAWTVHFGQSEKSNAQDRDPKGRHQTITWLRNEITDFASGDLSEQTIEKPLDTPLGERFFIIHIKRMRNTEKKNSGAVVILNDVTQQKRAESALQELTRWQKEATQNSERFQGILELAGAVCHDMNQPLMAISGYAELILMETPENSKFTEKLRKISEQVAKMGDITKKLMRITRYKTKNYMNQKIIDIDKSSSED